MVSYAKCKSKRRFWKVPQLSQFSWIILEAVRFARASIWHKKESSRELRTLPETSITIHF